MSLIPNSDTEGDKKPDDIIRICRGDLEVTGKRKEEEQLIRQLQALEEERRNGQ
jgi:hypothetical protein